MVAVEVRGARGTSGEGSGVLYKPRQIVTNHHVIDGAAEIVVAIANGERLEARLVASDPRTDLALLSVERDLPPATFARSVPPVGSLAAGGQTVSSIEDVLSVLRRTEPEDELTLEIVRDDDPRTITVETGRRPG